MAQVVYQGRVHEIGEGESVLNALLRGGEAIPYACREGVCGSCMLRAVSGEVPARARQSLKESWKAQGYFLPCVTKPGGDLEVAPVRADDRVSAKIQGLERLSDTVLRVRLRAGGKFEYRPGQYLTLMRQDGLARSYSIASLPDEELIELQVRLLPGGKMSGWLAEEARIGEFVRLTGPSGECFYVAGREEQPMVLAGTGTGLAPLWGIVRDALRAGHKGPIHLFHGAVNPGGLYLVKELGGLCREYPHLRYTSVVLQGGNGDIETGDLGDAILNRYPVLDGWRGFICGDPGVVQKLKRRLFLEGMAMQDIHSDSFLSAN
jgi:NAD(P)H-flavin reductase/ferredoxin